MPAVYPSDARADPDGERGRDNHRLTHAAMFLRFSTIRARRGSTGN